MASLRKPWFPTVTLLLAALSLPAVRPDPADARARIPVVAAENVWGSIVAQIGGDRVWVDSVLTDPNADPHEYESNARTAERFALARYVLINGAGYDAWAERLLESRPAGARSVTDVAALLGKHAGDNPHFWYSPTYVDRVAARIRDDLTSIDPSDRAEFARNWRTFEASLAPYRAELAAIRKHDRGRAVGATENIVVYLCAALGLRLVSPPAFMSAVANGTEPSAAAVAQFASQITVRQIGVLLYNAQTATAMTANVRARTAAAGIPIVDVTETIVPPTARFQDWQTAQLRRLDAALHR